jgi:hypothetical protein
MRFKPPKLILLSRHHTALHHTTPHHTAPHHVSCQSRGGGEGGGGDLRVRFTFTRVPASLHLTVVYTMVWHTFVEDLVLMCYTK